MKETGIIMSGNHPQLILDGTKTMTRRVIKPQPPIDATSHDYATAGKYLNGNALFYGDRGVSNPIKCPYGQVGDRLWVRETHWVDGDGDVYYKTDWETSPRNGKWKQSIHMFRKDSRITLEITEVRAERLHRMTEEDSINEGFSENINDFALLWDSLNAKRGYGWDDNPWVWVISFKVIHE